MTTVRNFPCILCEKRTKPQERRFLSGDNNKPLRRHMKDYNIMSLHGITDSEYISEFNLDPALEGTPAINDAMMDVVSMQNLKAEKQALLDKGVPADLAQSEAFRTANQARKEAESNLKAVIKQRGY